MDYTLIVKQSLTDHIMQGPTIRDGPRLKGQIPEYTRLRLDEPHGFIKHADHMEEIKIILDIFDNYGFSHELPKNLNQELLRHVQYFRNCLEVYDYIAQRKVFSIDELYRRCLAEGHAFTKFLKKCRQQTLQWHTSLEEEEYTEFVSREYYGYDSIFAEYYLINWDDTEEVSDWEYSLIEEDTTIDWDSYREAVEQLLVRYKLQDYQNPDIIRVIQKVANKRSTNLDGEKTTLLKNTWGQASLTDMWYSVRKIVPTVPGKTRDTGVPCPETLYCLKLIHLHARKISEELPYSANCSLKQLQDRVARLRRSRWFIHIDFKKFGLTVERKIGNIILELIGKDHLKIPSVYLNVDGELYETTRGGGSLGWLDPLFAIGVIAIISRFRRREGIPDLDFLVFNDDVEIGIRAEWPEDQVILLKNAICRELESYGFFISWRKVYASRMSVFLEEYYDRNEEFDMTKNQLAVKPYAKSLSASMPWKAKLFFCEGYKLIQIPALTELCQNSVKPEFGEIEYEKPLELGGWKIRYDHMSGLNRALVNASIPELWFYDRICRYREPHLMPKWETMNFDAFQRRKEARVREAIRTTRTKDNLDFDEERYLPREEQEALELRNSFDVQFEMLPPPLPRRRHETDDEGVT